MRVNKKGYERKGYERKESLISHNLIIYNLIALFAQFNTISYGKDLFKMVLFLNNHFLYRFVLLADYM